MSVPARSPSWKWWVCGLLLLATTINYMDRLTLNLQAKTLMSHFGFKEDGYGHLEAAFGSAFALGAIVMGWLADRINIRMLYTVAVILWSLAGLATGLVGTFELLLISRFALGFAEAGNWPCALRTTQHILPPEQRTFGNSILQSGAALGAILTPFLVYYLAQWTGTWRWSFVVVGVLGGFWALLWLMSVRASDLDVPRQANSISLMSIVGWLVGLLAVDTLIHLGYAGYLGDGTADTLRQVDRLPLYSKMVSTVLGICLVVSWLMRATAEDKHLPRGLFFRRYLALAAVVVSINITWHFLRAWLPLFLQARHGYTEPQSQWFILYYYLATDAGSLCAGFCVWALAGALGVHGSRLAIYLACGLATLLTLLATRMASGQGLEPLLLIVGFGALGLFPVYYSISQDITRQHQGKVTGSLGCICWLAMSLLQEAVGDSVKRTGSYDLGMNLAGLAPLVGLAALLFLWGPWVTPEQQTAAPAHPKTPGQ